MRKLRLPITLLLAVCLTWGCGPSSSEAVIEEFIAINDSLERTRREAGSAFERFTSAIRLKGATDSLIQRIDTLKAVLGKSDKFDVHAGTRLFDADSTGSRLFDQIDRFNALAAELCADDSSRSAINNSLQKTFPFASSEAWREHSFEQVPRVAVVTLLSKVQADVRTLENICVSSLLRHGSTDRH